jgi:hypothetical protein
VRSALASGELTMSLGAELPIDQQLANEQRIVERLRRH